MGKRLPKDYECDCGKTFRTPSGLIEHNVQVHGKPHPFACPTCGKRCNDAVRLERHKLNAHPAPKLPTDRRPTLAEIDATCLECGGEGQLVDGERIYPHRPDLYDKRFYLCACGAYCGCHPGSVVPLGHPCGPETRRARNRAHEVFDPLWKGGEMSRPSAYAWLAEATGIPRERCHIGMMSAEQARMVVRAVLARRARAA